MKLIKFTTIRTRKMDSRRLMHKHITFNALYEAVGLNRTSSEDSTENMGMVVVARAH